MVYRYAEWSVKSGIATPTVSAAMSICQTCECYHHPVSCHLSNRTASRVSDIYIAQTINRYTIWTGEARCTPGAIISTGCSGSPSHSRHDPAGGDFADC